MNLRLVHCPACRTAYMIEDEAADRPPPCPKCGAVPGPADAAPSAPGVAEGPTVFVPSTPARGRRGRKIAAFALAAVVVLAIAAVVAWPMIRGLWRRRRPMPSTRSSARPRSYLQALAKNDTEAARKLGTVDLPPAIRSYRNVRRDPAGDARLKGSFAPIAAFHSKIEETYTYDPAVGRYTPKNALGPAADVLDTLHEAKAKAEKDGLYKKMQSGDPNDLFDAAEGLARPLAALSEGSCRTEEARADVRDARR